jgi:hypothetical protein
MAKNGIKRTVSLGGRVIDKRTTHRDYNHCVVFHAFDGDKYSTHEMRRLPGHMVTWGENYDRLVEQAAEGDKWAAAALGADAVTREQYIERRRQHYIDAVNKEIANYDRKVGFVFSWHQTEDAALRAAASKLVRHCTKGGAFQVSVIPVDPIKE